MEERIDWALERIDWLGLDDSKGISVITEKHNITANGLWTTMVNCRG